MEESAPVLLRDCAPCVVAEHEADCGEEVALAGTVATDNYIVARTEFFDACLFLVGSLAIASFQEYIG